MEKTPGQIADDDRRLMYEQDRARDERLGHYRPSVMDDQWGGLVLFMVGFVFIILIFGAIDSALH